MKHSRITQRGFTLLELMVAVAVFLLIAGAAFALLSLAQQRSRIESQTLDSLQEGRLGLDQIVRDVSAAGYPPKGLFSATPAAQLVASAPFAWSPGYPNTPCVIGPLGTGCTTPSAFDLIVETDVDPQNQNGVEWVRYQLQGTTLFRGVTSKVTGADPAAATQAVLLPYVQNVMNNASAAQMALIQASYPTMFPGGAAVPVFTYTYDAAAAPNNTPVNIREVNVTLIVMAAEQDPRTGQPRVVTLTGRGLRIN